MKNLVLTVTVCLVLLGLLDLAYAQDNTKGPAAVNAPVITYEGGDGSSPDKAVIIKGATEMTGVGAEYQWLARTYPHYKMVRQGLMNHNGKAMDRMEIITADNQKMNVFFDISGFFGKMD